MIDYLPFIANGEFIKSKKFAQFDSEKNTEKLLFSYPRILKFVTVRNNFDFDKVFLPLDTKENLLQRKNERKDLIKHLRKNLKNNF